MLFDTRCAAYTDVNPTWEQRLEHAKFLCNDQWCVIRQHHSTSPQPEAVNDRSNVREQDGRNATSTFAGRVVFRDPHSVEAQLLGEPGPPP